MALKNPTKRKIAQNYTAAADDFEGNEVPHSK
jgi:hypothetical protein